MNSKIVYKPRELTFKEKRMVLKARKTLFNEDEGKLTNMMDIDVVSLLSSRKEEMFVGKGEECSCGARRKENK